MMTTIVALAITAYLQLTPSHPAAEQQVRSFVDAFNSRNIEGMLALAVDGVQWLSVEGQKVGLETEGKDALSCKSDSSGSRQLDPA